MKTSITYYLIIFQIIFGYQISKAQSSNALAFDGSNDLVTIPNASALISGSNAISLACWVYPTNPTPNTSSYDGIVGIRNNTDADFYILHFTANTVECRFRNSNGNNFDLIGTGIVLNAWQHLAFTYDGSMLRYYRNGVLTDSLPANGDITLNNESLFIGGTPYQGNQFLLEGRVDEVTFWDKAINGTDLNCLLNGSADTSDANLLLYYKFNQGTAAGNNTAITTLIDSKNNINGTLSGFALTGSTSNFISNPNSASNTVSASICQGDTFLFAGQPLTVTGIYFHTFTSTAGCDSLVELSLLVSNVNATITQNGSTLLASPSFATYQWINCITGLPITNATSVSYNTQNINGLYAVAVTSNGCTDTSACFAITTGINESVLSGIVTIYPNPVAETLNIKLAKNLTHASYIVYSVSGKEIIRQNINATSTPVLLSEINSGYYLIKVVSDEGVIQFPFIKK